MKKEQVSWSCSVSLKPLVGSEAYTPYCQESAETRVHGSGLIRGLSEFASWSVLITLRGKSRDRGLCESVACTWEVPVHVWTGSMWSLRYSRCFGDNTGHGWCFPSAVISVCCWNMQAETISWNGEFLNLHLCGRAENILSSFWKRSSAAYTRY